MGVIGRGTTSQATQEPGNIKPPAHHPERLISREAWGLGRQEVAEKTMIRLALPVGDHLNQGNLVQQSRGLQLHEQTAAAKPAGGAWHQKANRAQGAAAFSAVGLKLTLPDP
jgi:hypothetical protein